MNILVTGGAGFIGSNLVDHLLEEGHRICVIDNLYGGKKENLPLKSINFYQTDIRNSDVKKIFNIEKPEIVYHLAAQIDVRISVQNPVLDADVNILGTLNLLQNCVDFDIRKFIFTSSGGCIYGEAETLPINENHPLKPDAPYGISKLVISNYLDYYHKIFDLEYTILALGNVYGPRQDPLGEAGVIAIFAGLMLSNKQPVIYGDGNQLRDYIYVDDVVEAFVKTIDKADKELLNIGTGQGTSVNDLYEKMAEIIGFQEKPRHNPPRVGEIEKTFLDSSKAKNMIDWSPKFNLDSGLEKTIEWFKNSDAK